VPEKRLRTRLQDEAAPLPEDSADRAAADGAQAAPSLPAAAAGLVPQRFRVADRVFDALLGAILRGELTPGEPVPTQRALSREFGVSPLVVRHAIHRLEELELVRVRQGSPTIVLDPNRATDVRLIQLQLEAATPGDALALAGIENRALSTLPLLVLAARRISEEEVDELDRLVDDLGSEPSADALDAFQAVYWGHVASATRNPLLQHQVRWWFHTLRGLRAAASMRAAELSVETYRRLNATLRSRGGDLDIWLDMLRQLCDWTEAQPRHALVQAPESETTGVKPRPRFRRARD
jgi:GntR family transcriptional repressor for pyruvate dehydrogenase complex